MTQDGAPDDVLAVDVGGTAIKLGVVTSAGTLVTAPWLVETQRPCDPASLVAQIVDAATATTGTWRSAVVGFPGPVRDGVVRAAPVFWWDGPREDRGLREQWIGFDLRTATAAALGTPVIVVNDAAMHAAGAVSGHGVELVLTLGTGFGAALGVDGRLVALDLATQPFVGGQTYSKVLSGAAIDRGGLAQWQRSCRDAVAALRGLFGFDRLYIGGGNARLLVGEDLGTDVELVGNEVALRGGGRIAARCRAVDP